MSFRQYASQDTYEGGALACCSIALHWALACIHAMCDPVCDSVSMKTIFETGVKFHIIVSKRLLMEMIRIDEIIADFGMPSNTTTQEFYLYTSNAELDDVDESGLVLHLKKFLAKMRPLTAVLITANSHTTALFYDEQLKCYHFDSMPSSVTPLHNSEVMQSVYKAHRMTENSEAYAVILKKKN